MNIQSQQKHKLQYIGEISTFSKLLKNLYEQYYQDQNEIPQDDPYFQIGEIIMEQGAKTIVTYVIFEDDLYQLYILLKAKKYNEMIPYIGTGIYYQVDLQEFYDNANTKILNDICDNKKNEGYIHIICQKMIKYIDGKRSYKGFEFLYYEFRDLHVLVYHNMLYIRGYRDLLDFGDWSDYFVLQHVFEYPILQIIKCGDKEYPDHILVQLQDLSLYIATQKCFSDVNTNKDFKMICFPKEIIKKTFSEYCTIFVLTDKDNLYAKGWNEYGKLLVDSDDPKVEHFQQIGINAKGLKDILYYERNTYLIFEDGRIFAGGCNKRGQLCAVTKEIKNPYYDEEIFNKKEEKKKQRKCKYDTENREFIQQSSKVPIQIKWNHKPIKQIEFDLCSLHVLDVEGNYYTGGWNIFGKLGILEEPETSIFSLQEAEQLKGKKVKQFFIGNNGLTVYVVTENGQLYISGRITRKECYVKDESEYEDNMTNRSVYTVDSYYGDQHMELKETQKDCFEKLDIEGNIIFIDELSGKQVFITQEGQISCTQIYTDDIYDILYIDCGIKFVEHVKDELIVISNNSQVFMISLGQFGIQRKKMMCARLLDYKGSEIVKITNDGNVLIYDTKGFIHRLNMYEEQFEQITSNEPIKKVFYINRITFMQTCNDDLYMYGYYEILNEIEEEKQNQKQKKIIQIKEPVKINMVFDEISKIVCHNNMIKITQRNCKRKSLHLKDLYKMK